MTARSAKSNPRRSSADGITQHRRRVNLSKRSKSAQVTSTTCYESVCNRLGYSLSMCLSSAADICCRSALQQKTSKPVEALLRNRSRCARKLVRLGVGRRRQLQLLFRQCFLLPPPPPCAGFHFAPVCSAHASSPSNQLQVTQHLLRSRRAIDIFGRRTTHRCRETATPSAQRRSARASSNDRTLSMSKTSTENSQQCIPALR